MPNFLILFKNISQNDMTWKLKLHSENNFYSFNPFEFKLCGMVELCIPNTAVFFVFRF